MFKNNKNLLVIAVIAVVNALGYGIIFPILYSYSQRFGLSDFDNGLLFSLFSVCQFLSTPVIGRLSDKYGRKPLLLISLAGTGLSFVMMAFAPSAIFLFLARALDGITAGNIPVASAVISDTTESKDRAKGFGLIGAAFGFGFIFGPAISAFTVGINPSLPFIIAAFITLLAIILTAVVLPETNTHMGQVAKAPLFDFKKLALSVIDKRIGITLLVTLLYSFAFALMIYAYQPFAVKILHMNPQAIAVNFTIFGIVGLVAQMIFIPRVTKKYGDRGPLIASIALACVAFAGMFFVRQSILFSLVGIVLGFANSFATPLLQSVLSKEVDAKSQGSIQGIYSSYMSLGMIFGPIAGGAIATLAIPAPFLAGALVTVFCFVLARRIPKSIPQPESVF